MSSINSIFANAKRRNGDSKFSREKGYSIAERRCLLYKISKSENTSPHWFLDFAVYKIGDDEQKLAIQTGN